MNRFLIIQQAASGSDVGAWFREEAPNAAVMVWRPAADDPATLRRGQVPASIVGDGLSLHEVEAALTALPESEQLTEELLVAAREFGPTQVLSNSEFDIVRAAQLREELGVGGLKVATALRFRDKGLMNDMFVAAGLAPAGRRALTSAKDLSDAVGEWGAVVVKPICGAGSEGVHVVGSPAEADTLWQTVIGEQQTDLGRWTCEEYLAGDVFHADLLQVDGELIVCSVSGYLNPPHTFKRADIVSVMLAPADPVVGVVRQHFQALVNQIGIDQMPTWMHYEFFQTPDGTIRPGEIAGRLGGGGIGKALRAAYGFHSSHLGYMAASGIYNAKRVRSRVPETPASCGWRLWTCTSPTSLAVPAEAPYSSAWKRADLDRQVRSVDARGGVVATGQSPAHTRQLLLDLGPLSGGSDVSH